MPVVRRWLPLPAMAIGALWVGSLHSGPVPFGVAAGVTMGSHTGTGGAQGGLSLRAASGPPSVLTRFLARPVAGVQVSSAVQDARPAAAGGRTDGGRSTRSDAYGLNIEFLATCLSCTTAQAGPNSSGAEGRELRVAGETLSEGSMPANGYSSGALFILPENPLLRMAIAGWDGSTTADRGSSHAHARGSFLELAPADGHAATVIAGESASDAAYGERGSRGSGESNGLRAVLVGGQLTLVVLHSVSSSDSPGHVYVASVNDQEALPARDASGDHGITVPGGMSVAVLHSDGSGAQVGSASDGRSQRMVGIGSTGVGSPAADPQPLT